MRQSIKELAQMYALGAISEEQLEEACTLKREFSEALEYSILYYSKYENDMNLCKSYAEKLIEARDVIVIKRSFDDALSILKMSKLYEPEDGIDTDIQLIESVLKYGLVSEIMDLLNAGVSLQDACYEWDI